MNHLRQRRVMRPAGKRQRRRKAVLVVALTAVAGMLATAVSAYASAQDEVVAEYTWSMPDRTKALGQFSSVTDVRVPSPAFINPGSWQVKVDACGSTPNSRFTWEVAKDGNLIHVIETGQLCNTTINLPLDTYVITLIVDGPFGGQARTAQTVQVRDFLIVSFGDSFGSGEGNPEGTGSGTADVYWGDSVCHRSGYSGPAQAALRLERMDPHSSVTFVSLACSGASVPEGLIGGYKGRDGQVLAMSKLLCPGGCGSKYDLRNIDALILNVGGNDLHFAEIVHDCAFPNPPIFRGCHGDGSVTGRLAQDLSELPGRLDWLAGNMNEWLLYSQVYVAEYFDPTHRDDGEFCSQITFHRPGQIDGVLDGIEIAWAKVNVIDPLNTTISEAVGRNGDKGWTQVGGITQQFRAHGYCANDRWIRQYEESMEFQRDENGTMHPNQKGHDAYAKVLVARIRPALGI